MKNIELANKVISYCEEGKTIEMVIDIIKNHIKQDDVIDYVLDGTASVSENFELVFTCAEFLEFIDENEERTKYKEIEQAKQLLKDNGYYTDNLWCVEDVKSKFNCTDDEAYEVLDGALQNEATMEQIWFAIDCHGENDDLTRVEEENE